MKKYLIIIAVALIAFCAALYLAYHEGENHVQSLWDADKARIQKEVDDLKIKQGAISIKTITRYVNKTQTINTRAGKINDAVTKFVPKADKGCVIPNNVVTILDAAVNNMPIPEVLGDDK